MICVVIKSSVIPSKKSKSMYVVGVVRRHELSLRGGYREH